MKVNDLPHVSALAANAGSPDSPASTPTPWEQTWRYQTDLLQRSILFLDILRERANNMLAHEHAGLPPLLDFEYETILDARRFKHPANYALLRITGSGTEQISTALDSYRKHRDEWAEAVFKWLYG